MTDHHHDLDSYLDACVSTLRYEAADDSLRSWHERRRDVLAKTLHVPRIDKSTSGWPFDHSLSLAKQAKHPMSGVLEFPAKVMAPFEQELAQLVSTFSSAHQASLALARKILVHADPELETRTVTDHQLLKLGFDPASEPDEMEYL